ncbi:nicotinamide mononucleotide transporter [Sphingomonas sp. UYAg733]
MSLVEAIASLLIVINVALVARRSIWNYAFAIAGVLIYAWIFFQAKLYSDALLQGFFLMINLYGWRHWSQSAARVGEVRVERMLPVDRGRWIGGIVVATAAWGWLMHRFTDAALPWLDAGIAMASIAAQILLSRQRIENWVLWIAVDIVAIGMYALKDLWVTSALYIVLLAVSIWGLRDWRRAERGRPGKAGA